MSNSQGYNFAVRATDNVRMNLQKLHSIEKFAFMIGCHGLVAQNFDVELSLKNIAICLQETVALQLIKMHL